MTKMTSTISTAIIGSVLAGAIATASATNQSSSTIKLGNRRLRRGDASTEALLKKARPYKKSELYSSSNNASDNTTSRKLDQNANIPNGRYNVKFSQCVDMKLYDDDLFHEDFLAYSQNGQLVSTKSYVLFHVCLEDDCYYESEDDLYLVDLMTYLGTVGVFRANEKNEYCEACEEFDWFCNAADDDATASDDAAVNNNYADDAVAAEDDEAAAEEEVYQDDLNGQRRNLSTQTTARRTKSIIDCDVCTAYNCYANNDNDDNAHQQYIEQATSGWIAQLSQCKLTNRQWNGMNLYVGPMCSPYGDGVELAVFLDADCTAYTTLYSYNDVGMYNNDNNGAALSSSVEKYVKSAFEGVMSCGVLEFDDPNEADGDDDGGDGDDDDGAAGNYEANEYCQQLFEGGATDFNGCEKNNNNNNNQDDEYSWYIYDMDYDNSNNLDEVCSTIKTLDGEYSYSYDEENSGSWYSRDRQGHINSSSNQRNRGISWTVVLTCLAVAGVIAALVAGIRYKKKMERRRAPLYMGGSLI